jgi:hypothetical protein
VGEVSFIYVRTITSTNHLTGLSRQPVAWVALGIIAIIRFNFDYLLVVAVALVLNAANIIGFTKCRKGT